MDYFLILSQFKLILIILIIFQINITIVRKYTSKYLNICMSGQNVYGQNDSWTKYLIDKWTNGLMPNGQNTYGENS